MTMQNKPDQAGVLVFPPLLFGSVLLIGILISYGFPTPFLPRQSALAIGVGLLLTGISTLLFSFRAMLQHNTAIHPRGITTTIVRSGPYRYSRNPMYLSLTLLYIAVSVASNAWWGLLLLIPLLIVVQKGIIEREETYLTRKFGGDYLSYKAQVRRWL